MKNPIAVLGVLAVVIAVSASAFGAAPELCYCGNGGRLYLHSGGADVPNDVQKSLNQLSKLLGGSKSGGDKRITPDDLTGGQCRMPHWLDRNRIVFIYDLSPDSIPARTKVGILSLDTKKVVWIPALSGSIAIGYDKATGAIDFMKMVRKNPDSESSEVYIGQYVLKTGKAKSAFAFKSWGYLFPKPIYRWPDASCRLVPVGTSDVSDQVEVFSLTKKKFVPVKWLSDSWKQSALGTFAVMAMSPVPKPLLAMSAIRSGEGGALNTALYVVNASTGAASKVLNSSSIIRGPSFSSDGSWIAWWEESLQGGSKTVWISPTSSPAAQKISDGRDPAWRP
ncbi:MAG: hypothetical protein NTU88_09805 [Armatimonadetes bacterium]|nr:hypothetical protein [Armatimonadota bacterium]